MAATYQGRVSDFSWPRTVVLGWAADLRRDLRWLRSQGRLTEWLHAARIRWAQRTGRLAGFRQGWLDYEREGRA
jgi:rhamnosyltransferase